MSEGLPGRVDVARLAARGAQVSHVTPVAEMERVRDLLADDAGLVHSELSFSLDDQSRVTVQGSLSAGLQMTCQRCLEPVVVEVDTTFSVVVSEVETDEMDSVISEDGELSLSELVEDELLLALPIVAHHDATECGVVVEAGTGDAGVPVQDGPFAVLEKLKRDGVLSNGSPEES
jgi:uncharacterized protein